MSLEALKAIDFKSSREEMVGWAVTTAHGHGVIDHFEFRAELLSRYRVWVKIRGDLRWFLPREVRQI